MKGNEGDKEERGNGSVQSIFISRGKSGVNGGRNKKKEVKQERES